MVKIKDAILTDKYNKLIFYLFLVLCNIITILRWRYRISFINNTLTVISTIIFLFIAGVILFKIRCEIMKVYDTLIILLSLLLSLLSLSNGFIFIILNIIIINIYKKSFLKYLGIVLLIGGIIFTLLVCVININIPVEIWETAVSPDEKHTAVLKVTDRGALGYGAGVSCVQCVGIFELTKFSKSISSSECNDFKMYWEDNKTLNINNRSYKIKF